MYGVYNEVARKKSNFVTNKRIVTSFCLRVIDSRVENSCGKSLKSLHAEGIFIPFPPLRIMRAVFRIN